MKTTMITLCFSLVLLSISSVKAQPRSFLCDGANYTMKSPFQSNLNSLLASLSSTNATFFTDAKGQAPNRAYGLILCRGDLSPSDCSACFSDAARYVPITCPLSKQVTVWYDHCELRSSNLSFFNVSSAKINQMWWNPEDAIGIDSFLRLKEKLLDVVTNLTAYNTTLKFASGIANNWTSSQTVYALAQCTRDISAEDCHKCLQALRVDFNNYEVKKGGTVFGQSCTFRYESGPFFEGRPMVTLDLSVNSPPPLFPSSKPASPPPTSASTELENGTSDDVPAIVIPIVVGVVLLLIVGFWWWKRSAKARKDKIDRIATLEDISSSEWLSLNLAMLKTATDSFSDSQKLGQGGFGTVYKGRLANGEEIAVKRLSASSRQGIQELKNELILVAKLQHKNLVRLRSACLEEEEKLLVYEYLPNGSLDKFLFDPAKCKQLNWEIRFKLIRGIAQGLVYLHEESHLKVIHRDLKASNVLLDSTMNPKISDFGLARLFGEGETQHVTGQVVGTYGYMAPEYARRGRFSMKSDVYSYGILVLEIVTGKRSTSFQYDSEISQDILSHAWEHWINGSALKIVDPSMHEIFSSTEVLRCIQIALLCTQEVPTHRPTMSSVFLMLHGPSASLQEPLQPTFNGGHTTGSSSSSEQAIDRSNEEFARTLDKNGEKRALTRNNTWEAKKPSSSLGFDRQTT